MKKRRRDKAFALWLACQTQEEIAAAVEVAQNTVTGWEKEFIEKLGTDNLINSPDFDPPLYNVWKQQTKGRRTRHLVCGWPATRNRKLQRRLKFRDKR